MNAAARLEPNGWELQAVHIAFLRPPGNTAPDTDSSPFSLNARTGALVWSPRSSDTFVIGSGTFSHFSLIFASGRTKCATANSV